MNRVVRFGFFFSSRRRHTRWPRDWSSDVCSSDLRPGADVVRGNELHQLSIGVALILLACYVAYIAYSVFGVRASTEDGFPLSQETAREGAGVPRGSAQAKAPGG